MRPDNKVIATRSIAFRDTNACLNRLDPAAEGPPKT